MAFNGLTWSYLQFDVPLVNTGHISWIISPNPPAVYAMPQWLPSCFLAFEVQPLLSLVETTLLTPPQVTQAALRAAPAASVPPEARRKHKRFSPLGLTVTPLGSLPHPLSTGGIGTNKRAALGTRDKCPPARGQLTETQETVTRKAPGAVPCILEASGNVSRRLQVSSP